MTVALRLRTVYPTGRKVAAEASVEYHYDWTRARNDDTLGSACESRKRLRDFTVAGGAGTGTDSLPATKEPGDLSPPPLRVRSR